MIYMNIYIAHSTEFDYKKELYDLIRQSGFNLEHKFILPHENSDEKFSSKEFFKNGCDLVIAEISYASTGMGIELGWANMFDIPIVCIYKKGSVLSRSLEEVCGEMIEYDNDIENVINKLLVNF